VLDDSEAEQYKEWKREKVSLRANTTNINYN